MDDSSIHQNYGYWLYANEPGNLTLPNVGGSLSNQIYLWNNLKLNNGTDEVNITDKENRWVCNSSTCSENVIYYWNPLKKDNKKEYNAICGNRAYCDKTTISPYEGYVVWSNYDDITLIIGN